MSKTHRNKQIQIDYEDIPRARKSWGKVQPFTRVEEDKKKRKNRRACRDFKKGWKDE